MSYYERLEKVIGKENINKLYNTSVLVIGLGGVGGSSFETLVRSAIKTIYVCDYDRFEESNINRQILSNLNVIGEYKTKVAYKKAKEINEECNVIELNYKLSGGNINDVLPVNVDYIIDACDDVKVKIELVKFALKNNIKIISSMGTGNKVNPLLLDITTIWKTSYDPLAKKIRNLLKKEGISYKLPVVSSTEVPVIKTNNIIGSFAPVVNTAGILLASYVIKDVIE